eukprot:s2559_g3.t2
MNDGSGGIALHAEEYGGLVIALPVLAKRMDMNLRTTISIHQDSQLVSFLFIFAQRSVFTHSEQKRSVAQRLQCLQAVVAEVVKEGVVATRRVARRGSALVAAEPQTRMRKVQEVPMTPTERAEPRCLESLLSFMEIQEEAVEICKLHPDVIEWCPCNGLEDWLAWGTYQHDEETNVRHGALVLARLESDSGTPNLQANGIVVTGQDGLVHHLKACATGIQQIQSRKQHELEAWCVEVSHMDRNLVLSGGDDSLLRGWDLRTPNASPTFSNRSHEAGVISLACNPNKDVQLLTGSYDEHLRLFDLRHMKAPLLRSNRLGDGAYQLSWHSQRPGLFAVAAMRCGFPIFELKDVGDEGEAAAFNSLGGYCEAAKEGSHGSLGYGISWQMLGGSVAQAQRFNAQEAAEWISNRYQAVMEEYEKQKQTGKKDIQNFSDLNSDRPAWGGGAKPVLPGKEDFLQQLQTALLHFQRARQMEEGKGN